MREAAAASASVRVARDWAVAYAVLTTPGCAEDSQALQQLLTQEGIVEASYLEYVDAELLTHIAGLLRRIPGNRFKAAMGMQ